MVNSDSHLILIRGLPGSGKSTLARRFKPDHHFEADQWFMRDGEYRWYAAGLAEAHQWCLDSTASALRVGNPVTVVVANTFVKRAHLTPYVQMARELGVGYTVITTCGEYQNIHGVPPAVIERMRADWEHM